MSQFIKVGEVSVNLRHIVKTEWVRHELVVTLSDKSILRLPTDQGNELLDAMHKAKQPHEVQP